MAPTIFKPRQRKRRGTQPSDDEQPQLDAPQSTLGLGDEREAGAQGVTIGSPTPAAAVGGGLAASAAGGSSHPAPRARARAGRVDVVDHQQQQSHSINSATSPISRTEETRRNASASNGDSAQLDLGMGMMFVPSPALPLQHEQQEMDTTADDSIDFAAFFNARASSSAPNDGQSLSFLSVSPASAGRLMSLPK